MIPSQLKKNWIKQFIGKGMTCNFILSLRNVRGWKVFDQETSKHLGCIDNATHPWYRQSNPFEQVSILWSLVLSAVAKHFPNNANRTCLGCVIEESFGSSLLLIRNSFERSYLIPSGSGAWIRDSWGTPEHPEARHPVEVTSDRRSGWRCLMQTHRFSNPSDIFLPCASLSKGFLAKDCGEDSMSDGGS